MDPTQDTEIAQLRAFVERYAEVGLSSTSAKLVDYSGVLYNVAGSTADPKAIPEHRGLAWKHLLMQMAGLQDAGCYVTDPVPPVAAGRHPAFDVGGHMTPDPSGYVRSGDVSYLMPLCAWHNGKARDGVPFKHSRTRMLELGGFMLGDSVATFAARMPAAESFALVYLDADTGAWDVRKEDDAEAASADAPRLLATAASGAPAEVFVLFEKRGDRYFVMDAAL